MPKADVVYSTDEELPELFTVHRCSLCEEEARQEKEVCYCQECGDYLCSRCRKAHSRTRMTRGHQIMVPRMTREHATREDRASVLRHYRKDTAEGGLVREDGEPGSGKTQDEPGLTTAPQEDGTAEQNVRRRPLGPHQPATITRSRGIVEEGSAYSTGILATAILMSNISSWETAVVEAHAECCVKVAVRRRCKPGYGIYQWYSKACSRSTWS